MIRQHKYEILADEGNAARTGVVALVPPDSPPLAPHGAVGDRGNGRDGDGPIGGSKGGRAQMGMIADWPSVAACRTGDPDALFVQGAEQNVAKRICRSCPVRYECLADALDNRIEFGVWGGMTERERRALLRRHPQVPSWRKMFEVALTQNQQKELVPAG
jgi:WhiB family transcriptional regulator, redox-sensing transcriptional regulator